jgi:hypothetical protein
MEELLKQFPTQEAFDTFYHLSYKPVQFEDVRESMEALVKEAGLEIFLDDYVKQQKISKADFKNHFSETARFQFEDAMAEAYYDKNPEIYEAAFGLYELAPAQSVPITKTFHEEYQASYAACLDELFDKVIAELL